MVVSRMAKHKTEIAIYHLSKSGMRYLVVTVSPDGVIATRSASASATSFFIAHERLHIPGRHQPNLKPDAAGRLQNPGRICDGLIHSDRLKMEVGMEAQPGFFDIDKRLRELSSKGDDLERLKRLVDF